MVAQLHGLSLVVGWRGGSAISLSLADSCMAARSARSLSLLLTLADLSLVVWLRAEQYVSLSKNEKKNREREDKRECIRRERKNCAFSIIVFCVNE